MCLSFKPLEMEKYYARVLGHTCMFDPRKLCIFVDAYIHRSLSVKNIEIKSGLRHRLHCRTVLSLDKAMNTGNIIKIHYYR